MTRLGARETAPPPDTVTTRHTTASDPDLQIGVTIRAGQMHSFPLSLDPAKRQIISRSYDLGYTLAQMAAETGMPLGTAKTRKDCALRELRSTVPASDLEAGGPG